MRSSSGTVGVCSVLGRAEPGERQWKDVLALTDVFAQSHPIIPQLGEKTGLFDAELPWESRLPPEKVFQ